MAVTAAFSYPLQINNAAFYSYTNTAVAVNATANSSYRATTAAFTITLPTLGVGQWVVVARDQTAGTTTIGRNSQTIDAVAANFTIDTDKVIVLFYCTAMGAVVTRWIGNLPT